MAYAGTTSTASNPPALVTQGICFVSSNVTNVAGTYYALPRRWIYASSHTSTEIAGVSNFFSDGKRLGMVAGDIVTVYTSTFADINYRISVVSSTGGCTPSTGTITATT